MESKNVQEDGSLGHNNSNTVQIERLTSLISGLENGLRKLMFFSCKRSFSPTKTRLRPPCITELLVGLNYIWRFEREMNAKALFECTNFMQCLLQVDLLLEQMHAFF
uniref:Uncharacterized protein n=1 Tax=Davidia involucrata TaxID=16924 RepID=A0A5B7C9K3_DAVIN